MFEMLPARVKNTLIKKNITSDKELVRFFPYKYYDFSQLSLIDCQNSGKIIAFHGILRKIKSNKKNGKIIVTAKVDDTRSGRNVTINWIGNYYLYKELKEKNNSIFFIGGKLEYSEQYKSFSMMNPVLFTTDTTSYQRIIPQYHKIKGISEENLDSMMNNVVSNYFEQDPVPEKLLEKYNVPEINNAINYLHRPKAITETVKGQKRLVFDDMIYFSCKLEMKKRESSLGSGYNIKNLKETTKLINSLPFELTKDQKNAVDRMFEKAKEGKRINALVQGEVGSGKTITAFLMMFAMADSGYQSVLMAPTQILAMQHYDEISKLAIEHGFKAVYVGGKQKASEKKRILQEISEGTCQFVVGTQSVLSEKIEFKNLAMQIVDEEHKYGVIQRDTLGKRAENGMHTILMSATPIPRTLANQIYGDQMDIYNIESMPNGRKPIKTRIFNKEQGIYRFIEMQIEEGRQCYVVCPQIDKIDENSDIENIMSVEETAEKYNEHFKDGDIKIAVVTGKMDKETSELAIQSFIKNEVQILISTTVIEVGVNVPNASVIVINNAERFGLAGLHQLRGRVGRGKYQSYCILNSKNTKNERLNTLVETTNGFEIAEKDLMMRGTGSLIGIEQSGNNKYIELMLQYPNTYEKIKEDVKLLVDNGIAEIIIKMKEDK